MLRVINEILVICRELAAYAFNWLRYAFHRISINTKDFNVFDQGQQSNSTINRSEVSFSLRSCSQFIWILVFSYCSFYFGVFSHFLTYLKLLMNQEIIFHNRRCNNTLCTSSCVDFFLLNWTVIKSLSYLCIIAPVSVTVDRNILQNSCAVFPLQRKIKSFG